MGRSSLLLLADGRFPTGGHAHSGGLEHAVATGLAVSDLGRWLEGRLATVGLVEAAFAVAGHLDASDPAALDAELAARIPSAAARRASRAQGRGLLRTAKACWPSERLAALPAGLLWPVVLGVASSVAGLGEADTAAAAASNAVQGPAWAATRLTGMDPAAVAAALAGLTESIDRVVDSAVAAAHSAGADYSRLPALSAPALDIGAEQHALWEVRLFAS